MNRAQKMIELCKKQRLCMNETTSETTSVICRSTAITSVEESETTDGSAFPVSPSIVSSNDQTSVASMKLVETYSYDGYDSDADPAYVPDPISDKDSDEEVLEDENGDSNADLPHLDDINETVPEEPPKRSRWRKANPSKWKVNKNKSLKQLGLPYVTKKGIRKPGKQPRPINCEICKFRCTERITTAERESICSSFHKLDYTRQKDFLLRLIEQDVVHRKRPRTSDGPSKTSSRKYFFFKDKVKIRVCKNFFLNTLCISHGPVETALKNTTELVPICCNVTDQRGKKSPPNKTKPELINKIKAHIEKFPTLESHYCRRSSKRKYLSPELSIIKMYALFKKECEEQNEPVIPSEKVYRRVFCTEYNLSFFSPKKDQCLICVNYTKASEIEKATLETEYREHQTRKEEANASKARDKERASRDPKFVSATFDLQSVLQIPSSDVAPLYYSRKLCAYNLTVYEAASHKAYCFAWTEVNGQRGSCEIGTALLHWFNTLPHTVEEVSLFSDTCSGQNRNQYIAALFIYISQNFHFKVIEHKFLEKGHTHMEVDSMHSAIESAKKNVSVSSMHDWLNIFKLARSKNLRNKTGDAYVTEELRFEDFRDLKSLASEIIKNRTKDTDGRQVQWLKIKRLKYEKHHPGSIFFSYDHNSDYKELKINGSQKGRPKIPTDLLSLYDHYLPISKLKKESLIKLCKTKVIPVELHQWYESLPVCNKKDRIPEPSQSESESDEESV